MNAFLPPLVIDVRVREEGRRVFWMWLPVVLLWPLLFVLLALALLVAVVLDLALWLGGAPFHRVTAALLGSLRVLSAVRGTRVRVDSDTTYIRVNIY